MADSPNPDADPRATTQPGEGITSVPYPSDGATLVPAGTAAAAVILPPPGYALGTQIGRGGMGEVLAATDLRIGREVAVKRMIADTPDSEQVTRFLREARIQARLEHPSIVPVHELGVDERGRPFFTMKRLTAKTLADKQGDGTALNRLLRAFVDVCLAIEFAHSRGVVHRDLKPSNIMLGEYGEVYVIDWGISRVLADDREVASPQQGDIATLDDGSTKSGALLGTPGFMSPEQIRGGRATPPADIYALGAVLFELLVGAPLHKRGQPGIATTLSTPQVSPAARAPDRNIAPELDVACFAALAELPEERPTARELAEKVQSYLDGDRDLERRRQLARAQVRSANEVLATDSPEARASAIRRAGRAIALDPENEEAATIVGALLLDPPPPEKMPPDLALRLDDEERLANRVRSKKGMLAYLSVFGVLPLALVMEVKNWPLLIGFYGLLAVGALSALQAARTGRPVASVVMLINLGIAILFTRV
ncbi:MAG: serine/threonine-protein kinase, partial [Polyangiales bacterium]